MYPTAYTVLNNLPKYEGGAPMWDACEDLSIFDWWKGNLSARDIEKMRDFLTKSIALGFDGYVCFKVGVKGSREGRSKK